MPEAKYSPEARLGTVTLLFTDIERSTELLERLGDNRARVLWLTHLQLLRNAIAVRGGQEVKKLGDGLMVVFASALDALACAIAMLQAVNLFNQRHDEGHRLQVRVGLHVGEPIREEQDYFGMSVVVAKRLCERAMGGQILASDLVRRLVGSRGGHSFHDLGLLTLKGVAEAISAFEVIWKTAAEDMLTPVPLPPLLTTGERSAFVGRERELMCLGEEWVRARTGERRLVLLTGEPGIGKTRLASEIAVSAHAEGATVIFGHADEYATFPCQPFVEALRYYVSLCPVEKLQAQVGEVGSELAALVPEVADHLHDMLERPAPDLAGNASHRVFDAVTAFLSEMSKDSPVVLILDDLQWADELTPLLLRHIMRSSMQSPLLIMGTYREMELAPEHPLKKALADMRRTTAFRRISLKGLDRPEVATMIGHWLGQEPAATLISTIHQQTEGNPFFIEEVLRHLIDTGIIRQRADRWETDVSIEQMSIPEGVKEVVGQRLLRLSEECNGVLAIASVIGREFTLEALERASDLPGERLLDLLEEAISADVIREVPNIAGRYRFSHTLVHETLYEGLTATTRVRLHGQVLQYADSNGVKLAYEVIGGMGPHVLAVGLSNCPAIRSGNKFVQKRWGWVARRCRVILYDRRGVGYSAAPARGYSLLAGAEDIRAVLDAAGVERAVLWGSTDGGPLAISFAAQHPERTAGLILAGTSPKLFNSEDFLFGINPEVLASFLGADASDRGRAIHQLTRGRSGTNRADAISAVLRRVPKHAWSKITAAIGATDVRPLLADIRVPTLIVHDPDNSYIPVDAAYYLHEHIRGSRLEISEEYGMNVIGEHLYGKIEAFIDEVTTGSHKPWDMYNYHFMGTREALLRGDHEQAAAQAEQALKLAVDSGYPLPAAMSHLAKAHVMHESGNHREASEHLAHALAIAHETKSAQLEFHALWAEATFCFDRGEQEAGLASLRRAMRVGKQRGYTEPFGHRPAVMARLCARALEAGIEVEYGQKLVLKHGLVLDTPPIHLQNWPWAVKIFTLGGFELVTEGRPVQFSRKAQQKPLSLLKALVACGGRRVREEQLSDLLWPDAEGDMAHRSFATTLHRLRKLIGYPEAVQLREGCLTLDERYCWIDVWTFERLLERADAVWKRGKITESAAEEATRSIEEAMEIYRGPFLVEESEASWAILPREQMQRKFIRGVGKLAQYWEQIKEWDKAATCYHQALDVESLAEEFYRGLMRCYQQSGRRTEALLIYDRCKKLLFESLGIEPSSETEAVYRSVLSEN